MSNDLSFSIVLVFFCLGFFVPIENFSLIWRRHYYRWRLANFGQCSPLMAIEQCGFFNVSHLLWHWPTLYNGHFRGPVTLTTVAERLAVEQQLWYVPTGDRTAISRMLNFVIMNTIRVPHHLNQYLPMSILHVNTIHMTSETLIFLHVPFSYHSKYIINRSIITFLHLYHSAMLFGISIWKFFFILLPTSY